MICSACRHTPASQRHLCRVAAAAVTDPNASLVVVVVAYVCRRCLYEHYPRPKEFLLQHRIAEVLRRLLESGGRGADAVHQEAQRLLTAFQINVLF